MELALTDSKSNGRTRKSSKLVGGVFVALPRTKVPTSGASSFADAEEISEEEK